MITLKPLPLPQVVDQDIKSVVGNDGVALEALLSKELRHPNVVSTLHYVVKKVCVYVCARACLCGGGGGTCL